MKMLQTMMVIVFAIGFPSKSVFAEVRVLEIALTRTVQDRNPVGRYSPPAFCEKNQEQYGRIPTIDLSIDHNVIFWNTVTSTEPNVIRHTWHKKDEAGWATVAHVDMEISQSQRFRIWSSKDLRRSLHQGEWMIVVAPADNPKHVLCISRFLAE